MVAFAVVALTGGDYASPIAALADVAAWCGEPSVTNPCLVKIMPGNYDLGSRGAQGNPLVRMLPFVDIEGSGENATKLRGTAQTGAIVGGSDNAALRFLTVENENGGLYASAIENIYASPSLLHVTAISQNGTEFGIWNVNSTANLTYITVRGSQWGIYSEQSAATMANVTVTADGRAVEEYSSSSRFYNLRATGDVAFYAIGSSMWGQSEPVLQNSQLIGATTGPDAMCLWNNGATITVHGSLLKGYIFNSAAEASTRIAMSEWDGQFMGGTSFGTKCFQVYDANLDPVSCQ